MKTTLKLSFSRAEYAESFCNLVKYNPAISSFSHDGANLTINFINSAAVTDFEKIARRLLGVRTVNVCSLNDPDEKDAIIAKLEQQVKGLKADCEGMQDLLFHFYNKKALS